MQCKIKKKNILKRKRYFERLSNTWVFLIDPNKVAKTSDVCRQPCYLIYGDAVNVHDSGACSSKRISQSKYVVSVKYCWLNTEAFILLSLQNFFLKIPMLYNMLR